MCHASFLLSFSAEKHFLSSKQQKTSTNALVEQQNMKLIRIAKSAFSSLQSFFSTADSRVCLTPKCVPLYLQSRTTLIQNMRFSCCPTVFSTRNNTSYRCKRVITSRSEERQQIFRAGFEKFCCLIVTANSASYKTYI